MNKDVKVKDLKRSYDHGFVPTQEFMDSMPDLQNSDFIGMPINFVGMAGIRRPLTIKTRDGGTQEVLANIIGHVDNDANSRGINMSRLNRELAPFDKEVFDIYKLTDILKAYKEKMGRFSAGLSIEFEYRLWQNALRSKKDDGSPEGGWRYYPVEFELYMDENGETRLILWVSYIYSSTCPCSTELTMHNAYQRGVAGSPHAQRSVARIGIEFKEMIWIEDVIDMCKRAVASEVQTFVKRLDELSFSELCAAEGTVFVEDAIRRFVHEIEKDPRVIDYKVMCGHDESLHHWLAHSVMIKNIKNSLFTPTFNHGDMYLLQRLLH